MLCRSLPSYLGWVARGLAPWLGRTPAQVGTTSISHPAALQAQPDVDALLTYSYRLGLCTCTACFHPLCWAGFVLAHQFIGTAQHIAGRILTLTMHLHRQGAPLASNAQLRVDCAPGCHAPDPVLLVVGLCRVLRWLCLLPHTPASLLTSPSHCCCMTASHCRPR
jgi:hypothetical protein